MKRVKMIMEVQLKKTQSKTKKVKIKAQKPAPGFKSPTTT